MNGDHFDAVARLFAARRSRRATLAATAASLAALAGASAVAQDATPAATPAAGSGGERTEYLFLQSFDSGTIAPDPGDAGSFTLTLEQGLGQTVSFSDRPARQVGAVPTSAFPEGFNFSPESPPTRRC